MSTQTDVYGPVTEAEADLTAHPDTLALYLHLLTHGLPVSARGDQVTVTDVTMHRSAVEARRILALADVSAASVTDFEGLRVWVGKTPAGVAVAVISRPLIPLTEVQARRPEVAA